MGMTRKWDVNETVMRRKCNSETLPLARPPATVEWMGRKWDVMEMEMEWMMRQKWNDSAT